MLETNTFTPTSQRSNFKQVNRNYLETQLLRTCFNNLRNSVLIQFNTNEIQTTDVMHLTIPKLGQCATPYIVE